MALIVVLLSSAIMLAIIKQEFNSQYEILKDNAQKEVVLLKQMLKNNYSSDKMPIESIYQLIAENKPSFTFSTTGNTLIAEHKDNSFYFRYSTDRGNINSSISSTLNDAFNNDFARALLFSNNHALIGLGPEDHIIVSAFVPLNDLGCANYALITTMNMEEIFLPFSEIILNTLLAEFILLSIGTLFIVMIHTKSLRKEVRTAAKELAHTKKQIKELRDIEKSLSEVKKDMEEALEIGLFGFWLYNLSANRSVRSLMHDHIFGYDAIVEKWNLDTFLNHVHQLDREEVSKSFDKAFTSNTEIDIACRIFKRNNELRWIWLRGRKRNDGCLIGIIRDITLRKNMEKELSDFRLHLEELVKIRTGELESEKDKLEQAFSSIKTLKTLLPICCTCGKIREDSGEWMNYESYIQKYTNSQFSHSLCSDCLKSHYPDLDLKT